MTTIRENENNYILEVRSEHAKRDMKKILVKAFGKDTADYMMSYGAVDTYNNLVYIELNKGQVNDLSL